MPIFESKPSFFKSAEAVFHELQSLLEELEQVEDATQRFFRSQVELQEEGYACGNLGTTEISDADFLGAYQDLHIALFRTMGEANVKFVDLRNEASKKVISYATLTAAIKTLKMIQQKLSVLEKHLTQSLIDWGASADVGIAIIRNSWNAAKKESPEGLKFLEDMWDGKTKWGWITTETWK